MESGLWPHLQFPEFWAVGGRYWYLHFTHGEAEFEGEGYWFRATSEV